MNNRRRVVFIRYNPFTSIPLPSLLLVGVIGVVSGVYIFEDIVKNASEHVTQEREKKQLSTTPTNQ